MTKSQAVYTFWSSFGYPAYDESTVPTGDEAPDFPYVTFNYVSSAMDDAGTPVIMTASFWDRSSSWGRGEQFADQLSIMIRHMRPIECEGGYVWIRQGTPFMQRMGDPSDDMIRRILFNLDVKYLTVY